MLEELLAAERHKNAVLASAAVANETELAQLRSGAAVNARELTRLRAELTANLEKLDVYEAQEEAETIDSTIATAAADREKDAEIAALKDSIKQHESFQQAFPEQHAGWG